MPSSPNGSRREWNIYVAQTAAQVVIDLRLSVRLISLDGTNPVPVTQEFAQRIAQDATGRGRR